MIHQPVRLREIEIQAAEMGVSLSYAARCRVRYLWQQFAYWLDRDFDSYETWQIVCEVQIWPIIDDLLRLHKDLYWKNKPTRKGETTEEMKTRAKAYPVERLIELDRQGKALCLWHQDKTPSLTISRKNGKAMCFVCNKSYDAIDVVMARDGKTYHEAVKYLCGQ